MRVSLLERLLIAVAVLLFLAIVAGSAIALFAKNAVPGAGLRRIDPNPRSVMQHDGTAAFTRIGQLRVSTKPADDDSHAIVVVSPWLEYVDSNAEFYEELDRKQRAIRMAISAYFARFTEDELALRGERAVKEDLLALVNGQLVLGKITAIYFNEYQFLD